MTIADIKKNAETKMGQSIEALKNNLSRPVRMRERVFFSASRDCPVLVSAFFLISAMVIWLTSENKQPSIACTREGQET